VLDSFPDFLLTERRAQFEDFDMRGLNQRFESDEIDHPCPRCAVVPAREPDIMEVQPEKALPERLQVHHVGNESQVFLDLGVARVMPINEVRAAQLAEEQMKVAFKGKFFEGFPVFHA
jgi:hypothetical protein